MMVRGSLQTEIHTTIKTLMKEKYGPTYMKEKIHNRLKLVKVNMIICREILNVSGFGWDITMKYLEVDKHDKHITE